MDLALLRSNEMTLSNVPLLLLFPFLIDHVGGFAAFVRLLRPSGTSSHRNAAALCRNNNNNPALLLERRPCYRLYINKNVLLEEHQKEQGRLPPETLEIAGSGDRRRNIRFIAPLLEYGYRPAVDEYYNGTLSRKPMLLYLPGFDGTFLCPFLQYPELHTLFDVRCLTVATDDRSTLDELRDDVLDFLNQQEECTRTTNGQDAQSSRPVYLVGESFGGILACEVANAIHTLNNHDGGSPSPLHEQKNVQSQINLKGLTLINPATSFDQSILAREGPKTAELQPLIYPFGLLKLLPLFTDEYSVEQLLMIFQSKALPSVIDNEEREAYMGRVALSLPFVIPYMAQETLKWRLRAWLEEGCARLAGDGSASLLRLQAFPALIIVGEKDKTLPSVKEAERLSGLWPDALVHIVQDAGHASTCGSRVDLAALFRSRFPELQQQHSGARTAMKEVARKGLGAEFGMEPRYDNANIGLNPLDYWSSKYYRKYEPRS